MTIQFGIDGIGHQLADRRLAVPLYQRSYAWTKDQIDDYTADLRAAFGATSREYFLGTLVLSKEGLTDRVTVIDGQQRLATTCMLLAAIRDAFRERDENTRADGIHGKYIGSYDIGADAHVPRLNLNSEDSAFFKQIVVDAANPQPSRSSHELIRNARTAVDVFVGRIIDDAGVQWATRLVDWVNFIENEVRVIFVEVPTDADAFMIFETLNDRGADLTIADLLKNYLFGKAGDKLDIVRGDWLLALGALEMTAEDNLFLIFLRHYWSSKRGSVRERDLYKDIKEAVTNQTQALSFADELREGARRYAALLSSDHEFWNDHSTSTKDSIGVLNRLGLEQNRPLLLAAMQHFTKPQLKRTLRAVVSWSVRGLIVGGIGGGSTEKAFASAAVKIRDGSIKTAADLFNELQPVVPSDDEFRNAFKTARVTKASLARYYLYTLERQMSSTAEPELVPNADEEQVNLEHVLPKNAKKTDWTAFTDDERRDLVYRIGNLALLAKSQNTRIGNKPFTTKRPILTASQLALTKQIGQRADWTPPEIDDRQDELTEPAVKAWPRKPQ